MAFNPEALSKRDPDGQKLICTPKWFLKEFKHRNNTTFDLDVAASKSNKVAPHYLSEAKSAFTHPWTVKGQSQAQHAFLQPPWMDVLPWVIRAIQQIKAGNVERVTALLLAKTETEWFKLLAVHSSTISLITPRLNYYDEKTKRLLTNIAFGSVLFSLDTESVIGDQKPTIEFVRYKKPKGATR
jgi:phage N-6-adenine-methyltransferase